MKDLIRASVAIVVIVFIVLIYFQIDETVPKFKGTMKYEAETYVYSYCHQMANNFIEAEDGKVRGFVRADKKNIDRILDVLNQYSLDDDKQIRQWLREFENGKYQNAVRFHNHCWNQLDGEVGWAIDLQDEYK